jgi:molybdate transport system permease protein
LPVYTYVAFGSQGLPAMLPVLLPTMLAAVAVMALAAAMRTARPRSSSRQPADLAPDASLPAMPDRPARQPRWLSFAFQRGLDGFDLDVAWRTQASRIAILGASGSGKSMTLRLIAGLDRDRHGTLTLAGSDLSTVPPDRRRIAWVPQNYGLFPHLTVDQQVRFAVGSDPTQARHWLQRLGLAGLAHRFPDALSLGQRQRVALARFFSRKADLLLLDEPFSALDTPLRARLQREFLALQAEIDATTILVTHDPAEAFLLADELLILDAGRVLQAGPAETVFARPVNETVAKLLGANMIAEGSALDDHHIAIGDGIRLRVEGPVLQQAMDVGWSVRPESIRIAPDGDYPGTILAIDPPFGGRCGVRLRVGHCDLLAAVESGAPVAPGPCHVSIHPEAVQVWPLRAPPVLSPGES